MSEGTQSSQNVSKPLTAAERQDLYRSSIGNILNTYNQSGLPYGGVGSMTPATNATFDPNASPNPKTTTYQSSGSTWAPAGSLYNASGGSSTYDHGGDVTLDPKTYFQADDPTVNMPTGAPDPGGINVPVYQTPQYQQPGTYQGPGAFQTGGYTAGLDYDKAKAKEAMNSNAAKRGIWSSGLAEKAGIDIDRAYSGAYEKAGADQATAGNAYNLADAAGRNAFNQNAADKANTFNVTNANNSYQAGWQPLEYLRNLWNGTSGQTSGSNSFGQSLSMNI